jgi:ABC-type multidrug transport system ATPase subunit
LRASGRKVILTTHYMDRRARLSIRLVVLQSGKVRASANYPTMLGDVVGEVPHR